MIENSEKRQHPFALNVTLLIMSRMNVNLFARFCFHSFCTMPVTQNTDDVSTVLEEDVDLLGFASSVEVEFVDLMASPGPSTSTACPARSTPSPHQPDPSASTSECLESLVTLVAM